MNRRRNSYKNTQKHQLKVAIGPVFDKFGGVSQHILKIKKFSLHNLTMIPSKITRELLLLQKKINMRILGREMGYVLPYQKMMEIKKIRNFDVVHSHTNPWFTKLALSSKSDTCKWIHTYHTLYFAEDWDNQLSKWQKEGNKVLTTVASKADVTISVSQWLHDYLYEEYMINTEIVPNGADIEQCSTADPERFFRKYKQKDFVLYVGNIAPIKNPKLFVEMATKMPEITFLMIGRGIDPSSIMKKYRVQIPKNLITVPEITHSELLDALSACRAFVMTSRREGLPTVLLEAMALGKPVVVPAHSGCKEVVCSEKYGYIYQPNDLVELIDKTKRALDDSNTGKRARERVIKEYSWAKVIKKIDKIYESC